MRKRQKQMRKLSKPSWKWSVAIWHPHLVQPMLKDSSLMEGWWQLITDQPYQEKSWTKFSSCEKMRWWRTSILAGYNYKKHSFVFQCTTKTINMWSTKYDIYSSFLLVRGEGGCVCVCFSPIPLLSDQEVFFSMTFFTWIDFNNARISCKKILIFELYSMFLVIITFAFLHPFIDNSRESFAEIKNQGKDYFI